MKIIISIRTQLILIGFLSCLNLFAYLGFIPTTDSLTQTITIMFEKYGLPLVGLISFLENIGGLNAYFPGSVVILTAMALTAGEPFKALITFLSIMVPSIFAHNVNYFLGKTMNKTKYSNRNLTKKINNNSWNNWTIFFSTLWHPHFAAITCIAAGAEGLSFRKFIKYFLPASIFWNAFWGLVMYHFGDFAKTTSNLMPFFYGYIAIWAAWDIKKFLQNAEQSN